jgi:hypothetical protein
MTSKVTPSFKIISLLQQQFLLSLRIFRHAATRLLRVGFNFHHSARATVDVLKWCPMEWLAQHGKDAKIRASF